MGNLGVPELLIIAGVLVLLFGAKKLPDMARGIGKSLRIFKAETNDLRKDDDEPVVTPQPAQPVVASQLPPAPPVATPEEQARLLEEQAARLRGQANKPV